MLVSSLDNGGCDGRTAWVTVLGDIFFDELLISDFVNNVLPVADKSEGCHDEERGDEQMEE